MTTKNDEPRWLDVWEAADYIGVSEGAMRRLIRDRIVSITKPGGRLRSRIRISTADLDALMAAGRVEATTGPTPGCERAR
jgi:excisionase family DNA binding protein